jgi:hypothetical protein
MTRYTVVWWSQARKSLAQLWLDSKDRAAISIAADEIDRSLSVDASHVGVEGHEGFRVLVVEPLLVQFSVEDDDRKVRVWSVRFV